jgi:nucleoside-diphosphate-sugar epimerase
MKKLLVTGAGGLLGQALLPKLAYDKYDIYALTTDAKRFITPYGVTPFEGNLLEESSRRALISDLRPDALIHLAWDQSEGFRQSHANLNWLCASLDLLHNFQQCGGKRFLFAGSSSEYDGENGTFSEEQGFAETQYGVCKRSFTETAYKYAEAFGVSFVAARYFTIYGEHDRHLFGAIPSAIRSFLTDHRVICQSPDTIRDYVYVGDAACATVHLLESSMTGAVNIASGIPRTMREVFSSLAAELNAEQLLDFSANTANAEVLTADIGRMKNELGYTCKTDFHSGLKKTIDWWRNTLEV